MRNVYTIGETVFDCIFQGDKPVDAKAGGAMLNTSVSLGRLGVPVSLISEFANDSPGNIIEGFLRNNGVSVEFINRYDAGKTALALAFLDENMDAQYTFYKEYPAERLTHTMPHIKQDDILLFGSFYAITKDIRKRLMSLLEQARENKALVIYDPNFRKAHLRELDQVRPLILENISLAHIVRGSDEDFKWMFSVERVEEAYEIVAAQGCSNLIYTSNKEPVQVRTGDVAGQYSVPLVEAVSTIGAGDSFNAGVIYGILRNEVRTRDCDSITAEKWDDIISLGIDFGTRVCREYDNYIPKQFADMYSKK
ncbi:MAG: carbohydrate kinase [bacterium]|nr:carbohydrate kinase [bacterium]